MRFLAIVMLVVAAACAGGCTTTGGTPATAPETTAPSDDATTTTTVPPMITTTLASTTTVDRLTEIQAIFEDLERRRLEAIAIRDVTSFDTLYADQDYLDRDRVSMDLVEVLNPRALHFDHYRLLADHPKCVAFKVTIDSSDATVGGGKSESTVVLERVDGVWGYSWVGEGWLCDGSHPLSS